MKSSSNKSAKAPQTPVFPKAGHQLRPNSGEANAKPEKRDNVFSQSRDTREDRGTRQAKNTRNTQTLSRR